MNATLVLCDYAEEINGKLYMMGAGWNQVLVSQPINAALGILLFVPWNQTNVALDLRAELIDYDGQPVLDRDRNPVQVVGKVEVGRPPGLREEMEQTVPLAIRFNGLTLVPGAYSFRLHIGAEEVSRASFVAVGSSGGTE